MTALPTSAARRYAVCTNPRCGHEGERVPLDAVPARAPACEECGAEMTVFRVEAEKAA